VTGKVVSITDYGAFIELEEGLEGLVHISEIDWLPRPKHPSKYLSIGEMLEAVVLKVDKEERKLSLSIRQTKPSPGTYKPALSGGTEDYREGQEHY